MALFSFCCAQDAVEKQSAIWKTRQGIVNFPFGDVGLRSGHPVRFSHTVPQREASREHPAVRSVLAQNPVFAFEVGTMTFDMRHDLSLDSPAVLRMQSAEPFFWVLLNLVIFVPKHGGPAR